MWRIRSAGGLGLIPVIAGLLAVPSCCRTAVDVSDYARGPAPLRMPSPADPARACCYEDRLTGGQIFAMYCGYCHNPRNLAERPFANYRNVAAHMRIRANLTGKEYAKLMAWLRRWHDVSPPHPPIEPSPKRLIFSQPIPELRPAAPARGSAGQARQQPAGTETRGANAPVAPDNG